MLQQNEKLRGAALISKAKKVAVEAHAGQMDKSGYPYIEHPLGVAELLKNGCAKVRAVAYLHDVVEDTDWKLSDLRREGFPEDVVEAVDAISIRKEQGEDYYTEYLSRVMQNPIAHLVKFSDIADNSGTRRFNKLDAGLRRRLDAKYLKALQILSTKPVASHNCPKKR